MSQDVVADALNQIINIKKAGKTELTIKRYSKVLIGVLEIAKKYNYLDYTLDDKKAEIKIKIKKLNSCQVIKPRFNVNISEIEKYMKRFLPARDFGIIIISTNKGLITHNEAYEQNVGGSLIAYFY